MHIAAGYDDDLIGTTGHYRYTGDTRTDIFDHLHSAGLHTGIIKMGEIPFTVHIFTQTTDHVDLGLKECEGHSLVTAFSAGRGLEVTTQDGLTRTGEPITHSGQIHIETTDHTKPSHITYLLCIYPIASYYTIAN